MFVDLFAYMFYLTNVGLYVCAKLHFSPLTTCLELLLLLLLPVTMYVCVRYHNCN